MTHRPAFPAATAPPGSGPAGTWAALVEGAYQWLCQSRQASHPNHPVWHFRWNWNTWKPQLLAHLRASGPGYRLSPVPRVLTAAGERLECWEPQDALILKLVSQRLEPLLLPHLSRHCHHLKGRGGVKRAVHSIRQVLLTGQYTYVARSDAKGYYANIQHTRLLELLRAHCHDPALLDLVSQYCGRTLMQDGYFHTVTKGISLGSPLSPLMGALYLSPLDDAMARLPGIRYTRFMDDWVILARSRWHLRRAVRVMNQVLAHLGLEQHPDKTFIGRVTRGFDFLGVDFQPGAPLAPSAVSLARHTEKTARLHEQGASPERIGRYRQHWQRHLRGILGGPAAPAPTPPPTGGPTPPAAPRRSPVLSSHRPSHRLRRSLAGANQNINKHDENETTEKHIRSHAAPRSAGAGRRWSRHHSQRGDGPDHL